MRKARKHIILRSGFSQDGYKFNGMYQLFLRLIDEVGSKNCIIWPPMEWDESNTKLASAIRNLGGDEVMLVGYSYGGHAAIKTANDLSEGIDIPYMVLCDPVRQGAAVLSRLIPKIRTSWATLKVPTHVEECHVFLQTTNWPTGFTVIPAWEQTRVITRNLTTEGSMYKHENMDNCPEFHETTCRLANVFAHSESV